MPNIKKVAMLSVAALAVQVVLSKWIYPLIGKSTQQLYAIEPSTGIGGRVIGDKVLGYLSGYLPFDITNISVILAMFIGTFVLLWAGLALYENRTVKVPQGRNLTGRLFYILAYGHILLYLVLLLLKMGTVPGIGINLLIGLGLNLLLVSALVSLSAKYLNFPRI